MMSLMDPTPLIPLGERDVSMVDQVQTEYIWDAIQTDWDFSGRTQEQLEDVRRHHAGLQSEKAKAEYVFHVAEARARRPGGYYFVSRYFIGYNRFLRKVHDEQMGRRFEEVPGSRNRVFLLCHRDSYKSTFTGIALPICVLGTRPTERILLSGASDPDTSEMLTAIETIIEGNELLLALWPHLQPFCPKGTKNPKKWSEKAALCRGYYEFGGASFGPTQGKSRREVSIMVCGAEKSPTRLHPTLWIFDDLINLLNSESDVKVQKVLRFVREVIGNLGAGTMPMAGSGTMWRADDLAALILEGKIGDFDVFKMQVRSTRADGTYVYNMPREEVLAQLDPGEEPDPHCGFDDETFKAVTDVLTPYEVACQYFCDPSMRKKEDLDPEDWITFESDGPTVPWTHLGTGEEAEARWVDPMFTFAVCDLAAVISKDAKWTACWILGIDAKKRIWVLDGIYDKMEPWQQQNMFMQLYLEPKPDEEVYWMPRPLQAGTPLDIGMQHPFAWRPEFVCLEKANISTEFKGGMVPREVQDGFSIPWEDIQIQGQGIDRKLDRISKRLSAPFKQRRIRVRNNMVKPSHFTGGVIEVTRMFEKEYMGWGNKGVPVDGMDALSLGSKWFFTKGEETDDGLDEQASVDRRINERLLRGVVRTATEEDAEEWGVEPGHVIPAALEEDIFRVDIGPDW